MLKELIEQDFGIDLPISGGFGDSINDPIIITTTNPNIAAQTKLKVIDCINIRLERYWQATTTEIFKQDGKLIEKLKYVAKYIDGDNINSDTLNYYFDITKVEDEFPENPIRFGFPVSDSIDVLLPYQFGWLHYIDRIDNEIEHPGLGYSFAYNAPFTKATIYIYNLEHQRIDYVETPSLFEAHLDDISNQIMQSNPQTSFFNEFKYNNYVYRAYLIGGQHSAVLLGVIDNHFCKVRITTMHPDEKYEFECMMESIGYLSSIFNRS